MTSLTDFLLARLAEDEAVARAAVAVKYGPWEANRILAAEPGALVESHYARHDPARVLADVEAKRRAIEAAWDDHVRIESEWGSGQSRAQMSAKDDNPAVVECLALPFADHPDYQEAWKP